MVNTPHVTNYNPSHWLEIYVPQNVAQSKYVPQVPLLWHICGTFGVVSSHAHFAQNSTYLKKIEKFGTPIFYLVLFIDGGGGPKSKNDENDKKLIKMKKKKKSKKIN